MVQKCYKINAIVILKTDVKTSHSPNHPFKSQVRPETVPKRVLWGGVVEVTFS